LSYKDVKTKMILISRTVAVMASRASRTVLNGKGQGVIMKKILFQSKRYGRL